MQVLKYIRTRLEGHTHEANELDKIFSFFTFDVGLMFKIFILKNVHFKNLSRPKSSQTGV